jgi:peptide/nickel transport system permease protein
MTGRSRTLLSCAGVAAAGALAIFGLACPLPDAPMAGEVFAPISAVHPLGTNQLGQDNLLRTLLAAPGTLAIGLAAGTAGLLASTLYGFATAILPPMAGRAMLRAADILTALPNIVLAMLLATCLRPGPLFLAAILAAITWPAEVRLLAALARGQMQRDSFRMARIYGAGRLHLLRRHLLPPAGPVLAALAVQGARRAVMHASGLAFLGLTNPSSPTWGSMLAESLPLFYEPAAIWLIAGPAAALSLSILGLTFLGTRLERRHIPTGEAA